MEDLRSLFDVGIFVLLSSVPRDELSGVKSRHLRQGKANSIRIVFEVAHGIRTVSCLKDDLTKVSVLLQTPNAVQVTYEVVIEINVLKGRLPWKWNRERCERGKAIVGENKLSKS